MPADFDPRTFYPSGATSFAQGEDLFGLQITPSPRELSQPDEGGSDYEAADTSPPGSKGQPPLQPVAVACTECRSRHQKCDAASPICTRCVKESRQCCYIKSRRGWKSMNQQAKLQKQTAPRIDVKKPANVIPDIGFSAINGGTLSTHLQSTGSSLLNAGLPQANTPSLNFGQPQVSLSIEQGNWKQPSASFVEVYYSFFHNAHPIVLPPPYLLLQLQRPPGVPQLLAVIRFIGSCYTPSGSEIARKRAMHELQSPPVNGFTVQAMLLFGIALASHNEQEESAKWHKAAIDMALTLGMNKESFVKQHGEGSLVIEESWRRTWWELFCIDGVVAGVHQLSTFRLFTAETDMSIPCEEAQYLSGAIPPPVTLQEFDNRDFADSPVVFSSFAYRIDAVRVMGRVLAAGIGSDSADPAVAAADTALVTWALSLPKAKRELVSLDGKVDEMLFQSHLFVNAAAVYLHRPRSHMAMAAPDVTTCTPTKQYSFPLNPLEYHTFKAVRAADTITRLITLPTPLVRHTPFLTCVLTMAAVVQLSACSFLLSGEDRELSKDCLRLDVGALKTMEEVWPIAGCVLGQVKQVAREVFALRPASSAITETEVVGFVDDEESYANLGEQDYFGLPALEWDGSDFPID